MEKQQNSSNNSSEMEAKTPNFLAYNETWVGRESLIKKLTNKVKSSYRLLILVGITGIGKTALGYKLAVELKDWFSDWDYYLKKDFDNEEQTSDFGSVAAKLLEKSGEVVTPDDRKDTQLLMYRLVRHLQENRYLVQIDSLENILQGNEKEGWSDFKDEWWVKFFTTWLNSDTCQSCLILTSQDLPAQIDLEGDYQNWYSQLLSGLEEKEQLALFNKIGLDVSETAESKSYLERIGKAYEGHPLALRVIAGEIVNHPFNGNVLVYWNEYGKEVEEVEKAIEEAKTKKITVSANDQYNLHKYTRSLRKNVKNRLEKAFNRLKVEAHEAYLLLCESSVYRCEVPKKFWLNHLKYWDIDKDKWEIALDTLRDRYLVEQRSDNEKNQLQVRQHNLIRGVSLEHLRRLGDEDDDTQDSNQAFESNIQPSSPKIDILIITALKDELDALKNCDNQSGNTWQELKDSSNYFYYKTTLNHKNGTQLNIVAARPVEMGENYTNNLATRLISELKPGCLAMTGVCAGNRKDTFLGDVIVANRVFKFDYGKLVAYYESTDNQKIRTEEIFHDIRTYNLKRQWEFTIQDFPQDWLNTIQTSRPKSYYHQERWLVHKLYDFQQQPDKHSSPDQHPERQTECPDWRKVIQRLREKELLKTDSLELTEKALKEVNNERLEYLEEQCYKDPLNPEIRPGVIATTSKVQKDPQLFQRIEKLQRKILGVEMEGAAIGAVAEIHEIPIIIVKGVQDYADYDKSDQFRQYAAEVSARFLLAFFTTSDALEHS
ncbi:MAG: hypothetical protein WBA93_33840 [Microcoleaceae cyanobacterium]